jgi:hypothetical protein
MIHSTLVYKAKQSIQSLYELNNHHETVVFGNVGRLLEKKKFTCPCAGCNVCCPWIDTIYNLLMTDISLVLSLPICFSWNNSTFLQRLLQWDQTTWKYRYADDQNDQPDLCYSHCHGGMAFSTSLKERNLHTFRDFSPTSLAVCIYHFTCSS